MSRLLDACATDRPPVEGLAVRAVLAALQHQAAVLGGHPDQKPVRPAPPAIVRLIRPLHCCKVLKRDLRPLQPFEQADRTSNGIQLAGNVSIAKLGPGAFGGGCPGPSVVTSGVCLTRSEHP